MISRWIALPAVLVFLALRPVGTQAEEPKPLPPGKGPLARIKAAAQKMKAEGKSDEEILKAVRGMIDRALAQGPQGKAGPPPGKVGGAGKVGRGQGAWAGRGPQCPCPRCSKQVCKKLGCTGCPGGRQVQGPQGPVAEKVRARVAAAVQKMRAQGKTPDEIRAAVQKMRARWATALRNEGMQGPGKTKAPAPKEKPKKGPKGKKAVKAVGPGEDLGF